MKIHPDMTVDQLVIAFSESYPGLRLELYNVAHKEGENSSADSEIDHSVKLSDLNSTLKAQDWQVDPQMTVADFEAGFKDNFGLNIQVFRRSNNVWLQTSATDNWTLEVQNRKGLHSVQG